MPKLPEILKKELVTTSRLFGIEELHLRFANGAERIYERLRKPPVQAVMIVPLLDAETVLLIREYGAGTENYQLGLPKGAVDFAEDMREAANRELMEEVGYGARRLTELKRMTLSPSYMGHEISVFLAEDLYPERREGDEPEPIEVVPMKLADLERWVMRDDFSEARSIAALFMVRERLRAGAGIDGAGEDNE